MTATTNPLPKDSVYGVARRCVTDLLSPVEIAIRDALVVVEELGADPLLTEASVKLSQAKSLVADWLEGATRDTLPTETRTYQDGSTATGPAPLPLHSPEEQGFSALIVGLGRDGAMAAWGRGAAREARVEPVEGSHLTARSDEKAPAVGVGSPVSAVSTAMEVLTELVKCEDRVHLDPYPTTIPEEQAMFTALRAAWDRAKALVSAQGAQENKHG